MREIGVVEILLLVLSVLSHVGMSIFLARPRFNRVLTALIWFVFSIVFLGLPAQHPVRISLSRLCLTVFCSFSQRRESRR